MNICLKPHGMFNRQNWIPAVRCLEAALFWASVACHAQPVTVRVDRQGDEIVIDVEAEVSVAPKVAWAVLTDYEHMASFVSSLTASSVVTKKGNSLQVAQAGEQHYGPFRFAFNTVRAVELVPESEIRSRLVKGTFKSFESITRITTRGATTLIIHHGSYVPDTIVPPLIGPAVIREKTAEQFRELIAEMYKHHSGL